MKKFLVLVLVLALASTASAISVSLVSGGKSTLVIGQDVQLGGTIQVDLVSDTALGALNSIDFLNTGEVVNAVGAWSAAMQGLPNNGTLVPPTGGLNADIMRASAGNSLGGSAPSGTVLYSFVATVAGTGLLCPSMGSADVLYTYAGSYAWGTAVLQNCLHIVPEPVTIALLGLGGLLLRRRR